MKNLIKMLTQNIAETSPTHEDQSLRTQSVDVKDPVDAVSLASKAFQLLPRARVIDLDVDNGQIRAERKTFLGAFTDDMNIQVTRDELNKRFTIHVKSSSRVGKGDLGQNAKNIRAYYQGLSKLTKVWKDCEVIS